MRLEESACLADADIFWGYEVIIFGLKSWRFKSSRNETVGFWDDQIFYRCAAEPEDSLISYGLWLVDDEEQVRPIRSLPCDREISLDCCIYDSSIVVAVRRAYSFPLADPS